MHKDEHGNIIMVRRDGVRKGVYLLPNLCTMASLFCGFFAVVKSLNGLFVEAAWAIIIAGVFDFLDGRIARLTHAESDFGIEFDSLVDLASFGLAPGILLYTWALVDFNRIGWLVAFLFFACGALRLARFNVQIENVERTWFQGLPIPVAAYVIATMVIFYHHIYGSAVPSKSIIILATTVLLSLLMVSTIPYRSFKQIDLRNRWSFFALVAVVGIIFVIAAEPQVSMFIVVLLYVALGLVEEAVTLRTSKAFLEMRRRRKEEISKTLNEEDKKVTILKG